MELIACPACSGSPVRGRIDEAGSFYPSDVGYFLLEPSIRLRDGSAFNACIECGLVWSFADPKDLRGILAKHGVPEGGVPKPKSYALHLGKWLLFIALSCVVAIWLYGYSSNA